MSTSIKRLHCERCQRPLRTCFCHWVTPTANLVELVILQHPLEVNHGKNTAGLLHLSLANNQLHMGETFAPQFLTDLLHSGNKTNVLLYPAVPEEKSLGLATPGLLPDLDKLAPEQLRLIVLDGTWRKSRKMLYLNRSLQTLPRLALTACPPSLYRIRKAHRLDQLSTLEAGCYALCQLENGLVDYTPLLKSFGQFIDQVSHFLPGNS